MLMQDNDNQPGNVFSPGGSVTGPAAPVITPETPPQPTPAPPTPTEQPTATAQQPAMQPAVEAPEIAPAAVPTGLVQDEPGYAQLPGAEVRWTASEYVAHHKSTGWYMLLAVATVLLSVGVYFVTSRDIVSAVVVALAGIIFGVYAARKPQVQEYAVTSAGVAIGAKTYPFTDLKSFAIVDEGALSNSTFVPLKRFMPAISVYYDPADEDAIVAALSQYLPIEERRHDPIDRLMNKIRF